MESHKYTYEIFDIESSLNNHGLSDMIDNFDALALSALWSKTFDSRFTKTELKEVKRFFQTPLGEKIICAEKEAHHVISEEINKQISNHNVARTNAKRSNLLKAKVVDPDK